MMGRRERGQGQLFYEFSLDEVVPPDHLVRQIDAVLDLGWVHKELEAHYSHTGRPSIDPELMIRMLIVGYVFAIRSERRICAEVQVNLAYRWFCKLGIEDAIPNHSAFSRARNERFRESHALRCVFERVVARCIATGLVGGEAFSIDASLIKADVDKKKRAAGDRPIEWPRAEEASHAVREYLAALDAAHSEDDGGDGTGGGGNDSGRGGKPPKEVSLTDPQAAWVARKGVDPFFAYDATIDNKFGIILDAEGTRANRTDEIAVTETMIERVEHRFGLAPERLAGDTAYGAARLLKWLWDRGIAPHVPVWDKSKQTGGRFTKEDFVFDRDRNVYICPAGAALTHSGIVDQGRILPYRASKNDCSICGLKPQCTTAVARKVSRDIDEDVRDQVRALANTEAFQVSRRERKKVEVRFAHMKGIHKLDRLRLRGLSGAKDEVLLTATAQNLKRLAKLAWRPPRPVVDACAT
jgi:transposase